MTVRRLLSIDPSLTCSGWALFSLDTDTLIAVGKVRSLPPTEHLATRLDDLQAKAHAVFSTFTLGERDILVCEAPTTMRDPKAALKVEQVRCIFEAVARERKVRVPGRLNPRSVHRELMGHRGPQLARSIVKESAVHLAHSLFSGDFERIGLCGGVPELKRHQDVVDAVLIGHLSAAKIRSAELGGVPIEEMFQGSRDGRRRVG